MSEHLGPNALLDEEADRAFHARHEAERRKRLEPLQPAGRYLTHKDAATICDNVADAMAEYCRDVVAPLKARIAELEARPAGTKYLGVHEHGRAYGKGDFVTKDGSLWAALRDHPGEPGTERSGWRLAVKRGRDGRDGVVRKSHALA